jgi:hypothetical protein
MVTIIGLAATLIFALVEAAFGYSFDWRAEVPDEFKDQQEIPLNVGSGGFHSQQGRVPARATASR